MSLHDILRLLRELPRDQQNLFCPKDRKAQLLAACRYASEVDPVDFEELFSDIVVVSAQLLGSTFEKKNQRLFVHLLPDLKHSSPLTALMIKADQKLHAEMVQAKAAAREVRSILMDLRFALQDSTYLVHDEALRCWKKGQRSAYVVRFLTVADIDKNEHAEYFAVCAEPEPALSSSVKRRCLGGCSNASEAVRVGRRMIKERLTAFADKPKSKLLQWYTERLAADKDNLAYYETFTADVRTVEEHDPMLAMFAAVGKIRFPQNMAKTQNFDTILVEAMRNRPTRRQQICYAALFSGYINEVSVSRGCVCISNVVDSHEPITTASNWTVFFARAVLKSVQGKIGLDRLVFIIMQKKNAVWLLALLSICSFNESYRNRILSFLFRQLYGMNPCMLATICHQMRMLLLFGSTANVQYGTAEQHRSLLFTEDKHTPASSAGTLFKAYAATQFRANRVIEGLIMNRNWRFTSILRPIVPVVNEHPLCRSDREAIMALFFVAHPFPWNSSEENPFYLPKEIVQTIAQKLSGLHEGTRFEIGERVPNVFIDHHAY